MEKATKGNSLADTFPGQRPGDNVASQPWPF